EHVSRLCPLHEHGPAHRVDVVEVQPRDVLQARVRSDLLVGGIAHVQLDDRAGLDLERRVDRVVPDVVEGVLANAVERARRIVHQRPSSLRSSAAFTEGQSSSITAYQAESRRSLPRTTMCLRWIPSNSAGRAASARRARSFLASVLNSTRRKPSSSKACRSRRYFASTLAPVFHIDGFIHVFPISTRRCWGSQIR